MANEINNRDQNHVTVLSAITNDSNQEIRMLRVDPATGRLIISAVVAGTNNGQLKVSAADTTYGYLYNKLTAGSNVTLTILNPGANETVQIDVQGGGYDEVQENAVSLPLRNILNFTNGFTVSDNVGNVSTDVAINESELDLANIGGLLDLSTQVTGLLTTTNIDESSLDLANIGGSLDWTQIDQNSVSVDLSTQVTGVLDATNINITNLESTLDLGSIAGAIDLTTQVTGLLPATNIDVAGLITAINLTGDIEVIADGVTITGNGTIASPLTATPGIGGDIVVALTAGEDLTAGDTVGFASFADDTAMKAVWAQRMSTSASITTDPTDIFSITEIDTDKYVIAYADNGAPSGAYRCIVAVLDRDTLTWTFGARSSSFGIIVTGNVDVVKLDTNKFALARFISATNPYTIRVYACTVSGTTITIGSDDSFSDPSTDNGSVVSLSPLGTDRFAMLITGSQAGSHCDLFEVTVSGTVPAIGTQEVIQGTGSTVGLITTVDTDKVVFMRNTSVWCATVAAGVWTVGSPATLTLASGTLTGRLGIKSVSTSSVFVLTANNGQSIRVQQFSISGTTLASVASTVLQIRASGNYLATLASDGTDVFLVTQSGDAGLNGISKLSVSGGAVIFSPFSSFDLLSTTTGTGIVFGQNIFEGSNYFGTIKNSQGTGGAGTVYQLDFNEYKMTERFVGIAQSTVARGAGVNVKIAGVDTNQTGLTAGALYNALEGGIVSTSTQSFNSLQAQSSTDLKI